MTDRISEIKKRLNSNESETIELTTDSEILLFQKEHNLILPRDLIAYFKTINGGNNEYDSNLYKLYRFQDFKSIDTSLKNWNGIPDYSNIVNTLKEFENYYVFADYFFNMFTYAIKLNKFEATGNEVLVICGDEYKVIANNFSGFLDLYINNSIELQFKEDN